MRLSPRRYEEIQEAVQQFAEDWGICEYPIDPFEICKRIGIQVCKYSELSPQDREKAVKASDDGVHIGSDYLDLSLIVIAYNDNLSISRVRYTICHELGHIVLEHTGEVTDREESEADWFAEYLLVPTPLAIKYRLSSVSQIQSAFGVSYQCANVVLDHSRTRISCRKAAYFYEVCIISTCYFKEEVHYVITGNSVEGISFDASKDKSLCSPMQT